jgi:hypothetical protein
VTTPEISDAQRRLLAAVAERLPDGQVRELYLFAPMRQGGVETGLAVIAAAEPTEAPGPEAAGPGPAGPEAAAEPLAPEPLASEPVAGATAAEPADDGSPMAAPIAPAPLDVPACTPEDAEVVRAAVLAAEAAVEAADRADETIADEAIADEAIIHIERTDDAVLPEAPAVPPPLARYTVYTARYRLQLKGPDRGKWAMELVAEADAPLLTVDAVVRGVQRRAGDVAEVERLTGPELARLLGGRS